MPLLDLQVRFRELGRIRAGEKGEKGEPRKLEHFRLTSASRPLLEQAAAEFGGTVTEWKDGPDAGLYELKTETDRIDVMIPPVADAGALLSQHYELWSGGGCVRRCDGLNEQISGGPCMCMPDERTCKPTTRLSVMIPKLGGIGVWRLDTGGYNAALELPGTFGLIVRAADGQFMPAVLRLEQRSSKKDGQTRRYVIPVLDMEQATILDLVSGNTPGVLGPAIATGRPQLPPASAPPNGDDASFVIETDATPALGPQPDLPSSGAEPAAPGAANSGEEGPQSPESAPDIELLHDELVALVTELGATDSLPLIEQKTDAGNKQWLKRQITTAKKALAERGDEQGSFFVEKARQAQEKAKH
jgi:recombination directionality factor gp3-like protein